LCDVDAGRVKPIRLAWLVPLTAIWTNIHGGVLAGVATLGLTVAGWIVWKIAAWLRPDENHASSAPRAEPELTSTTFLEHMAAPWPTPLVSWGAVVFPLVVCISCLGALLFNP